MSLLELESLKELFFEIGPIRPPSEGGSCSLLIRVTRICPWNQCKFCYGTPYNREKFQLKSLEEIKRDIDAAKAISELIKALAKKLGGMNWAAILLNPYSLYNYNKSFMELNERESKNFQSVMNVFEWLLSGAKSINMQTNTLR